MYMELRVVPTRGPHAVWKQREGPGLVSSSASGCVKHGWKKS